MTASVRRVSQSDVRAALETIAERGIAESVRTMLSAHVFSPGRIATMRMLGDAANMSQRNTNRVYGQFAGRVRRELGLPDSGIELAAIATWPAPPIDAAEEFSFRMRAPVAEALLEAGIVSRPKRRKPRPPQTAGSSISTELYEGAISRSHSTRWERNQVARRSCIDHFGPTCQACGFDFARKYGELGKDFIEVHHTSQFAREQGRHRVDPLVDLVPVCSNCHRMLHRQDPPLGLGALRKILDRQS